MLAPRIYGHSIYFFNGICLLQSKHLLRRSHPDVTKHKLTARALLQSAAGPPVEGSSWARNGASMPLWLCHSFELQQWACQCREKGPPQFATLLNVYRNRSSSGNRRRMPCIFFVLAHRHKSRSLISARFTKLLTSGLLPSMTARRCENPWRAPHLQTRLLFWESGRCT